MGVGVGVCLLEVEEEVRKWREMAKQFKTEVPPTPTPRTSACTGFGNLSDNHHGEENSGEP